MIRRFRGLLLAAASLLLGVAVTAVLLRRAGIEPGSVLSGLPWRSHALALALCAGELVARGARVALVARGLGLPLSLGTSVRAQLAADALAAVTPSRVGSDPAKMAILRGGGVGLGGAGALVLGEMIFEAVVLVLTSLAVWVLVPGGWWVALGVAGYALLVSSTGAAAMLATRLSPRAPPRAWSAFRLGAPRWAAVTRAAGDFRAHAASLRRLPAWAFGSALAATLAHIALRLAVLPALALPMLSASGVAVPVVDLVLRPLFVLYATALLPPPGGGGGVELAFAATMGDVLSLSAVAALLAWWRIYTFYLSAAAGCLYLGVSRVRHPKMLDTEPSPDISRSFAGATERP